jgi:hypothetical protein
LKNQAMLLSRRRHRRPRYIGLPLAIIIVFASPPYPILPPSSPRPSRSNFVFVEATQVTWTGNGDVSPEHEAAHSAPRSQRYWDEHGIKRPDYAKTDAEIAAERRRRGGGGGGIIGRIGLVLLAASAAGIVAIIAMANATGRLDEILSSHPAGSRIARFSKRMTGSLAGSGGGNKLGRSSSTATTGSEEEARRTARLARFDNPRNMLDDMKTD